MQAIIQTLMIGFGYLLSYALIKEALLPPVSSGSDDLVLVQLLVSSITSVTFSVVSLRSTRIRRRMPRTSKSLRR